MAAFIWYLILFSAPSQVSEVSSVAEKLTQHIRGSFTSYISVTWVKVSPRFKHSENIRHRAKQRDKQSIRSGQMDEPTGRENDDVDKKGSEGKRAMS